MISKELIGSLSVATFAIGETIYLWSVFRGRTRPHVFSWIVWSLLTGVAFFAQRTEAAGAGTWATGATSIVCFFTAIVALFKGEKDIAKSDVVAFVCGLLSIPVWRATGDPLYAVLIVSAAEVFAFYPTIRKSWFRPWEEPAVAYGLDGVKYSLSLLAMENFTFTAALYPFFITVVQALFITMLLYRRRALATK